MCAAAPAWPQRGGSDLGRGLGGARRGGGTVCGLAGERGEGGGGGGGGGGGDGISEDIGLPDA